MLFHKNFIKLDAMKLLLRPFCFRPQILLCFAILSKQKFNSCYTKLECYKLSKSLLFFEKLVARCWNVISQVITELNCEGGLETLVWLLLFFGLLVCLSNCTPSGKKSNKSVN